MGEGLGSRIRRKFKKKCKHYCISLYSIFSTDTLVLTSPERRCKHILSIENACKDNDVSFVNLH